MPRSVDQAGARWVHVDAVIKRHSQYGRTTLMACPHCQMQFYQDKNGETRIARRT